MHAKPSSHKARHIEHTHPLPKYSACSRCKSRKVRCSGQSTIHSGCDACRRSAKFNGEDPDLVVCSFGKAPCGSLKPSTSTKMSKARSSSQSPRLSRTASPFTDTEGEAAHDLEARMAEMDQIVQANLQALPQHPSEKSSSPDSRFTLLASSASSSPSTWAAASTSTNSDFAPLTMASSSAFLPPALPVFVNDVDSTNALYPDFAESAQSYPALWQQQPQPVLGLEPAAFNYFPPASTEPFLPTWTMSPAPSSPSSIFSLASFESASSDYSLGDQTLVCPDDQPLDLPPNFSNSAHVSDTLSLPLFPIPPYSTGYNDQGILGSTIGFEEAAFWNSEWVGEKNFDPSLWTGGITA